MLTRQQDCAAHAQLCDHAVKLFCIVQDATQLALKIVTNYALSDAGITTYASPGQSLGYMRKSFEVSKLTFGGISDHGLLLLQQ